MAKRTSKELQADKDLVVRLQQRFRLAETARQSWDRIWADLDVLDRGEHWKDADLPPWIPKPVMNMVRYIRTLKRSNLAANIPSAHYYPIFIEQKELIDNLQRAYKHVWQSQKVSRTVRRAIDRSILNGTTVATVYTDDTFIDGLYYGENDTRNQMYQGQIIVKRVPIANFFPDPDANCLYECKFVEITYNLPLKSVKAVKSFQDYAGKKLTEYSLPSTNGPDAESGQIYKRENYIGQRNTQVTGDEMVTVHAHYERYYNDETKKYQLDITYYLAKTDFILFKDIDVKPSVYPFAVLYDEEEENQFWGSSTIMDIAEMQKIVNRTNQTASIIGTMHQNPQKVVMKDSGINAQEMAKTGTYPGKVWTSSIRPQDAVHVIQPADIPRGLFELKDRMISDIKDNVGVTEAYTGQSVGSLTTSTGVNSLIERATVRDKDKMVQIDAFVEEISDLIILNIMYKWKENRTLMTLGANKQPEYSEFTPIPEEEIDNLRWLARSDVYATAPTTQAKRKEEAQQLLQLQGQFNFDPPVIIVEEYVDKQDYDNKDEIIARIMGDREKMMQKEQMNIAQTLTQLASVASDMRAQGLPEQEITEMIQQKATELVQQREEATKMTRPRDAASTPQAPQGTTGAQAMNAMVQG